MQKLYRRFRRWWIRIQINQRNDYIRQYKKQLIDHDFSPGELLAEIERLRIDNARDKLMLEALQ